MEIENINRIMAKKSIKQQDIYQDISSTAELKFIYHILINILQSLITYTTKNII